METTFLEEKQIAPLFETFDQDAKPFRLVEQRGNPVVLFFYPHDQTPTCTQEVCNLRDHEGLLRQNGFMIAGISTDSAVSHQKFIQKHQLPFPLLVDPDLQIHQLYGVWQEKKTFGKTYFGTVRTTFLIDEQGIIQHIIRKVQSKNHAQQILEYWKSSK